jgi:hypothetical protein
MSATPRSPKAGPFNDALITNAYGSGVGFDDAMEESFASEAEGHAAARAELLRALVCGVSDIIRVVRMGTTVASFDVYAPTEAIGADVVDAARAYVRKAMLPEYLERRITFDIVVVPWVVELTQ